MDIGLVGLGKMGGNMVRRLTRAGFEVCGLDRDPETTAALASETGMKPCSDLAEMAEALKDKGKHTHHRIVWLMLPAGEVTEQALTELTGLLDKDDVIVDGANSNYRDSLRRHQFCLEGNVEFVDAGVSGGVWGLENGYTVMLGGEPFAVNAVTPVIRALAPAPDRGWLHCGPPGSGHFVKMVHNGIEYGMMQAYAEGFALMRSRKDFDLDLAGIAETWRHGSVVRSWLLDLTAEFLAGDQELNDIAPFVADSGEGRWSAIEGIDQGVPTPVISLALMMRFASQGQQDYASKMLSAMRRSFGGHAIREEP